MNVQSNTDNNKQIVKDTLLHFANGTITLEEALSTICPKMECAYNWIPYNFYDIKSRPKETGKYFVQRKDGKVHWETWNGSGFAYNNNVITHYCVIKNAYQTINNT